GIVFVLAFSTWVTLTEAKLIPKFLPFETYYAGLVGNVLFFAIGYLLAAAFFKPRRDLTNLTIWTQTDDWKALND
ncbi:MAG TPA: hypothetical protein PLZ53_12000, partial [Candidatus Hydrogenedentes bacterium]|nr:hypothetical protein [Candidatus Hydrogenedentota bacterium]